LAGIAAWARRPGEHAAPLHAEGRPRRAVLAAAVCVRSEEQLVGRHLGIVVPRHGLVATAPSRWRCEGVRYEAVLERVAARRRQPEEEAEECHRGREGLTRHHVPPLGMREVLWADATARQPERSARFDG